MRVTDYPTRFHRGSGLIAWDPVALAACRVDADLARILHAAAVLEQDTGITGSQARALGLERPRDLAGFLGVWEAEEAEHARALRFLLTHQAYAVPPERPASIPRRRHRLARVPLGLLGRAPQTPFVFCVLGAAAEYVAIVIYSALARVTDDAAAASLLRAIARQEARHFAFFLAAARVRGDDLSSVGGGIARRALAAVWEPVGVPSLGADAWEAAFGSLLARPDVGGRVAGMDRIVDTIPHLAGLELMAGFLGDRAQRVEGQRSFA